MSSVENIVPRDRMDEIFEKENPPAQNLKSSGEGLAPCPYCLQTSSPQLKAATLQQSYLLYSLAFLVRIYQSPDLLPAYIQEFCDNIWKAFWVKTWPYNWGWRLKAFHLLTATRPDIMLQKNLQEGNANELSTDTRQSGDMQQICLINQ